MKIIAALIGMLAISPAFADGGGSSSSGGGTGGTGTSGTVAERCACYQITNGAICKANTLCLWWLGFGGNPGNCTPKIKPPSCP